MLSAESFSTMSISKGKLFINVLNTISGVRGKKNETGLANSIGRFAFENQESHKNVSEGDLLTAGKDGFHPATFGVDTFSQSRSTTGGFLDFLANYTSAGGLLEDPIFCSEWLPANHIYFQIANIFLFLSYLAPNGLYGILYLRVTLTVGCIFLSLWGWIVLCTFDALLWNSIFVIINLTQAIVICFHLWPVTFTSELEQIYCNLFQPLRVSRQQFKKALGCMKQIRHLHFQEIYAQEKVTRVDSLSLVLSGRLVISQNGRALHIVSQHQFLDSPEWFGVSTDEFFQVSATAIEESRILIWHRDKLKLTIINDQFLQSVFDHILGRDVVKKLMQIAEFRKVNENLSNFSNGSSTHNGLKEKEAKHTLVVKNDETGNITVINTRQMHANDGSNWKLGRIEETELETPV